MRSPDLARRKSFAVKPDEPVASLALISSIMPRGVAERPQTYRLAFTIAVVAALIAAIAGALPIAVLLAAFAVPIVYIVYIYDVNLWEDQPVLVAALAFVLSGFLGAGLLLGARSLGWLEVPGSLGGQTPTLTGFVLAAVAVPVGGEVVRQIGPVILASRPEFDDLMDGLTFGVISGVAFATADTLIRHWALLTGGFSFELNPALWATLIFLEGFVKPLIFGTATAIACAEYSGLGAGYDGFTGNYLRGLADALLSQVAYAGGVYLLGFVEQPTLRVMLQLTWGLMILAVLIIRVRTILHTALMEAALEAAARQHVVGHGPAEVAAVGATPDPVPDAEGSSLDFCARCEMPLLPGAAFCTACGTAARTCGKSRTQQRGPNRTLVGASAGASSQEQAGFDVELPSLSAPSEDFPGNAAPTDEQEIR